MAQQTGIYVVLCWLMLTSSAQQLGTEGHFKPRPTEPKPLTVKVKPAPKPIEVWHKGQVTTYAQKFDGRPMANGRIFRHAGHDVACRGGKLGRRIEIRYGKNGRAVCTVSDRGRLPLHEGNCWQFDVPRQVALELGLYRINHGRTDREVRWRYLD